MPPPMMMVSAISSRLLMTPILLRDLAAAQNGDQGTLGVVQGAADDLQLLLDKEAGHGGQVVGHTGGGGVGAVDGAEGVGDVDTVAP